MGQYYSFDGDKLIYGLTDINDFLKTMNLDKTTITEVSSYIHSTAYGDVVRNVSDIQLYMMHIGMMPEELNRYIMRYLTAQEGLPVESPELRDVADDINGIRLQCDNTSFRFLNSTHKNGNDGIEITGMVRDYSDEWVDYLISKYPEKYGRVIGAKLKSIYDADKRGRLHLNTEIKRFENQIQSAQAGIRECRKAMENSKYELDKKTQYWSKKIALISETLNSRNADQMEDE